MFIFCYRLKSFSRGLCSPILYANVYFITILSKCKSHKFPSANKTFILCFSPSLFPLCLFPLWKMIPWKKLQKRTRMKRKKRKKESVISQHVTARTTLEASKTNELYQRISTFHNSFWKINVLKVTKKAFILTGDGHFFEHKFTTQPFPTPRETFPCGFSYCLLYRFAKFKL